MACSTLHSLSGELVAASLWQRWMGRAAAAAAACAVILWFLFRLSGNAALAAGMAIALCAPSCLVVLSFLVAVVCRDPAFSAGDTLYLIRALMFEIIDFNLATIALMAAKPATNQPPGRVVHRPVLLIHGFACNHSVWRQWLGPLEAGGFGPVRVIDLEPPFADIEHHAAHVERELRALFQDSGDTPVDIVAHSMGGLVARAALRRIEPGIIGRIVTLATPHHGSTLARLFRNERLLQQMVPQSAWLNQLNAEQENGTSVPITTLYSLEDNLVLPARSARLKHAHPIELRGMGHFGLLCSRTAMDYALASLAAD